MPIVLFSALAALAVPGAGLGAQQPLGCPVAEDGAGTPIELRVGDLVLRAQISSERAGDGAGARVEGRLIGCEREQRIGAAEADPDDATGDAPARPVSVLRLLHDLRVAFEVVPGADGCVRAELDVEESKAGRPADVAERPLTLQLCGLPLR
jgi:hypothetical protein